MTRATTFIPVALLSILPLTSNALCQQAQAPDLPKAADAFVSARVAADSFSGVVLVARQGKLIYQRAAGLADRERGTPMQLSTRLQIASTTKLFTQIAIRQLEQAGKLSLTDTVGKFLPDYPNPIVRSRVTVEQLIRHRSGVGSFWNAKFMARAPNVRSVHDYMELFQDDSLLFVEPADWSLRAARFRWAELLRRIFEVDPLACPRCRGLMRLVAVITDPAVITRILAHRARARDPTHRSRSPPPRRRRSPTSTVAGHPHQ
ncbi:MAG TPA: serine hydrolase [Gemmatimonadales bacterium]|jgi:CubicO group peptidase (beta-lactamase class C family)|nr:serine hydrolase [Gemmatimonadales bacterium]